MNFRWALRARYLVELLLLKIRALKILYSSSKSILPYRELKNTFDPRLTSARNAPMTNGSNNVDQESNFSTHLESRSNGGQVLDHDLNLKLTECLAVLKTLAGDTQLLAKLTDDQRIELFKVAGLLSRPDRHESKRRAKELKIIARQKWVERDRAARAQTGIRQARTETVFTAPLQLSNHEIASALTDAGETTTPRNCYVCKAEFTKLHHFYDSMCPPCADFNYAKRFQTASLAGQIAVITGARLKIGYHATLLMLRSGARVIATTRFPVDAARRFALEPDYAAWSERLQIHGLDLRHTPSVEIFCQYLEQTLPRLDILINNAAQTVRRPPGFYSHMMESETTAIENQPSEVRAFLQSHLSCTDQLNKLKLNSGEARSEKLPVSWHDHTPGIGLRDSARLSQLPYSYDNEIKAEEVFPNGKLDADLQQVDLRVTNTWRLKLGEVPTPELLEVQLVNAIAPFILCSRLSQIMRRDFTGQKHIVNVTAMEGKFYRFTKPDRHPHTNMAKAALNMLTHTSASDLEKDGIYMNAVDTGWVTDEDPAQISQSKQAVHDFQPPLDIVDGAARICDPFYYGINSGHHWCGKFLKDYQPIDW